MQRARREPGEPRGAQPGVPDQGHAHVHHRPAGRAADVLRERRVKRGSIRLRRRGNRRDAARHASRVSQRVPDHSIQGPRRGRQRRDLPRRERRAEAVPDDARLAEQTKNDVFGRKEGRFRRYTPIRQHVRRAHFRPRVRPGGSARARVDVRSHGVRPASRVASRSVRVRHRYSQGCAEKTSRFKRERPAFRRAQARAHRARSQRARREGEGVFENRRRAPRRGREHWVAQARGRVVASVHGSTSEALGAHVHRRERQRDAQEVRPGRRRARGGAGRVRRGDVQGRRRALQRVRRREQKRSRRRGFLFVRGKPVRGPERPR
mmetsp:Transcript_6285/g.26715  ORF Transcript_6285/g.26715 Transcript_6285/m.26715 type:complete len:321 (-) Transcript_6285:414-1376(-)